MNNNLPTAPKVSIPQHPLLTSITLHLLPGVVLFALLPLELGILLNQSRKQTGRFSLNVSLFALHHLWTPLLTPGRILAWLPIIFIVWRQQNIYIGLYVHLITNLAGSAGILLGMLSAL